jgi:hypothetical protein
VKTRRHSLLMVAIGACSLIAVAGANDYPKRKPGLWEVTRTSSNSKYPPQVQQICLDAATDAMLYKVGESAGRGTCSKLDVQRSGGKVVVDSICALGKTQLTSHNVVSFSGDSAYHEDIAVHYDPPLFGKKADSVSTQDAKWIGACTADMKPGDIVSIPSPTMPVALRMNIRDMLKDSK